MRPLDRRAPAGFARELTTREVLRLLGQPPGREPPPAIVGRVDEARAWFEEHARPWARVRAGELDAFGLAVPPPVERGECGASVVLACAVSAGAAIDAEVERLWQAGRPDEAAVLDRLGAAAAERLLARVEESAGARLRRRGLALSPHASPGCGAWPLEEQAALHRFLFPLDAPPPPEPLRLLESCGLAPRFSTLAVHAVLPWSDERERRLAAPPCARCTYTPCAHRGKAPAHTEEA